MLTPLALLALVVGVVHGSPAAITWTVLGPFPYSYRQQGADPVLAWGDPQALFAEWRRAGSPDTRFPSELTAEGFANFTSVQPSADGTVMIGNFSNVDWNFLAQLQGDGMGATGTMWQGWAFGEFAVNASGVYEVQCVDGDFTQTFTQSMMYIDKTIVHMETCAYSWVTWPVSLLAGQHLLTIKISGQAVSETFKCTIVPSVKQQSYLRTLNDDILPHIVDRQVLSNVIGFTVQNMHPTLGTTFDVYLAGDGGDLQQMLAEVPIAAGQALPVTVTPEITPTGNCQTIIKFLVTSPIGNVTHDASLECVQGTDPFVFTFLDFDGSAQEAAVRAPLLVSPEGECNVIWTFHGADVEAVGQAWTGSYIRQPYLWILFPTNRRRLGSDWQGQGLLNAERSLDALVDRVGPQFPCPPRRRVIFAGHSMGGHGCALITGLMPDLGIASVPAAGWLSWPLYVPTFLLLGQSEADPRLESVLASSLRSVDAELYVSHYKGLPLMVRNGMVDNVVPPLHLKRLARRVNEVNNNPNHTLISEIPNQGHWFNGVVDDKAIQDFFDRHANTTTTVPPFFEVVCISPLVTRGSNMLRIERTGVPMTLGRLVVNATTEKWYVTPHNVIAFRLLGGKTPFPKTLCIVDRCFPTLPGDLYELEQGGWSLSLQPLQGRQVNQTGPLDSILLNNVTILYGTQGSPSETDDLLSLGTWLANDLYMTSRYAARVLPDTMFSSVSNSNIVLLGTAITNEAIARQGSKLPVRTAVDGDLTSFNVGGTTYSRPGLAAVFLAPLSTTGLQLIVSGSDMAGVRLAMKLFPAHTAMRSADFVIAGPEFARGAVNYGLHAAGYFDYNWGLSSNSWLD